MISTFTKIDSHVEWRFSTLRKTTSPSFYLHDHDKIPVMPEKWFFSSTAIMRTNFYFITSFVIWFQAIYTRGFSFWKMNVQDAAKSAQQEGLQWPTFGADGRFATRNQLGAMISQISTIGRKFIEESSKSGHKIGCAYGSVCVEALKSGAGDYVANDLDDRHLKILAQKVMEDMPEKANHLMLMPGSFPESTRIFANETFDAILIDNVMHFFTENQVKSAFAELKRLLKPGGRLLGATSTPYLGLMRQDFIQAYEQNVSRFLDDPANSTIPGFIENGWDPVDWSRHTEQEMLDLPLTKGHAFVFDQRIMASLLSDEKFVVLANEYEAINRKPWSYDGRERLVFVAQA